MSLEEQNRNRGIERFQTIMHLGMGSFYIIIGLLVLYVRYFGTMELSAGLAYALGGLMILYGVFRLWRGFVGLKQQKLRR